MARKLLAYALNRSLQLSDETLIARMKEQLTAKSDHADAMIEAIVTSPQFLNKRSSGPAKPVAQSGSVAQLNRKTKQELQ